MLAMATELAGLLRLAQNIVAVHASYIRFMTDALSQPLDALEPIDEHAYSFWNIFLDYSKYSGAHYFVVVDL